jgi:hypothetical protein
MYLTAQMHRSFASLKMTAYIYVANLPDTTLEGRSLQSRRTARPRASFRGSFGLLPLRGLRRFPGSRPPGPSRARHLPDSRVPGENEFAGVQGRLLEILGIGRKDLPARDLLPQHLNGSHVGELAPQTLVVLLGGGEPHPVVGRRVAFIAEDEDNLVLNVDRKAAEHGAGHGRQRSERVEHECMRDRLALLDGEEGIVQRDEGRFATGL